MAKKKKTGVNKAAAIRDYLAANPEAKGVDVVAALKSKGIVVAPAQVSNIKTGAGKKKAKKSGGGIVDNGRPKRGRKPIDTGESQAIKIIDAAFTLVAAAGSVDAAISVLNKIRPVQL